MSGMTRRGFDQYDVGAQPDLQAATVLKVGSIGRVAGEGECLVASTGDLTLA